MSRQALEQSGLDALARAAAAAGSWVVAVQPNADGPRWMTHPGATIVVAEDARGGALVDGRLDDRAALAAWLGDAVAPGASDAELVLSAVRRAGPHVLVSRLRGVFVAVVWDRASGITWAARDPVGIHPLFLAQTPGGTVISPAIDALLGHPKVSREVDAVAIAEHLAHRWAAPDETYLRAIRRVPAGHVLALGPDGARSIERAWDPAPCANDDWLDDGGAFDALLDQAVARATCGMPTGIFLSGGFDSVSVAAMAIDQAERHGTPPPLALSLAFPDPSCNEEPVQRHVARQLGIRQTMLPFAESLLGRGLMASAFALSARWPVPLQNPWRPAYLALAAAGRAQGCRVVLTGNGGDDWLTVGPDLMADLLGRADLLGAARYGRAILRSYSRPKLAMVRYLIWRHGLRPLAVWRGRQVLGRVVPGAVRRWRRAELQRSTPPWLAPDPALRRTLDARIEARIDARETEPEPSGRYPLYLRAGRHYLTHPLTAMDHEEDFVAGRRVGLPLGFAHPYWDADLLAHLARTSPWALLDGGREKGLVRQAVHRRFPGVGFLAHRKVTAAGFFTRVVSQEGPGMLRELGGMRALADLGIAERRSLDAVVADGIASGQLAGAGRAWEIMNVETWLRARSWPASERIDA